MAVVMTSSAVWLGGSVSTEVTGEGAPRPGGPFSPAQAAVLSGLSSQERARRAHGALGPARGSQRGPEAWGRGVGALGLHPPGGWNAQGPRSWPAC